MLGTRLSFSQTRLKITLTLLHIKFAETRAKITREIMDKSKEITRFIATSPADYLKVKDPLEIPSRHIVAGPNSPTPTQHIFEYHSPSTYRNS